MKEYTFSYVFCSGLLQSWYELCGWEGVLLSELFGLCGGEGLDPGCLYE